MVWGSREVSFQSIACMITNCQRITESRDQKSEAHASSGTQLGFAREPFAPASNDPERAKDR